MGIFDKFKKKKEEQEKVQPQTARPAEEEPATQQEIQKEKSFMLGIPLEEESIMDPNAILERLRDAEDIELSTGFLEDGKIIIQASCLGNIWTMEVWATDFVLPEFYQVLHFFPDMDIEALKMAKSALVVAMDFDDDPLRSYHAQLKLLDAMLPDKLAVLDESSEKMLSPLWVSLAASSRIDPSPNYVFTVQAVGGGEEQEGQVWLHTHGLNRCGITELEILDANTENYQSHYHVITNLASRLLDKMQVPAPKEPIFLGRLTEEVSLVVTLVPWEKAVKSYKADKLGGKNDRQDSHNGNTSIIYVYPTEDDYEKKWYRPVSVFDDILAENPMYWLTDKETARMKALALERISYMQRAFHEQAGTILIKVGLELDPQYKDENSQNSKEHIWFELIELDEGGFTAKLTQEPYYVDDLHEGDVRHYKNEEITDWIIFTEEGRITPDDVYLMEELPKGHNDALN